MNDDGLSYMSQSENERFAAVLSKREMHDDLTEDIKTI